MLQFSVSTTKLMQLPLSLAGMPSQEGQRRVRSTPRIRKCTRPAVRCFPVVQIPVQRVVNVCTLPSAAVLSTTCCSNHCGLLNIAVVVERGEILGMFGVRDKSTTVRPGQTSVMVKDE